MAEIELNRFNIPTDLTKWESRHLKEDMKSIGNTATYVWKLGGYGEVRLDIDTDETEAVIRISDPGKPEDVANLLEMRKTFRTTPDQADLDEIIGWTRETAKGAVGSAVHGGILTNTTLIGTYYSNPAVFL